MRFFGRPSVFNGNNKPINPADKGRIAHDQLLGGIQLQNRNLRLIILFLSISFIALCICIGYLAMRPAVRPYVVRVDKSNGTVQFSGFISDQKYVPQQEELEYFLRQFIRKTREIPLDPVVFNNNRREAAALMTQNSLSKLQAIEKNEKIKFGKETVQVNIDAVIADPSSNNSYRVQWHETSYDLSSGYKQVTYMTGLFTFIQIAPKNKKSVENNPLGIYVAGFNWDRDSSKTTSGGK